MNSKLTIKQDNFCTKYIELGNASEAYRHAYNAENMSDKSVNELACRQLKKVKIESRLAELKAEHKKRHEITVDLIIERLEEARNLGLTNKQASAAVQAAMGQAKVAGLLVDKHEVEGGTIFGGISINVVKND